MRVSFSAAIEMVAGTDSRTSGLVSLSPRTSVLGGFFYDELSLE